MDNRFRFLYRKTAPRTPEGDIDYESPQCLDMKLLDQHFAALSRGEEIIIPKFEFARQMRNDARGTPLKLGKNEIAIFEGIHALNDDIAGPHPEAAKLYISARSNVNDGAALRFKGTWTLFDKSRMATFERCFIDDKSVQKAPQLSGAIFQKHSARYR